MFSPLGRGRALLAPDTTHVDHPAAHASGTGVSIRDRIVNVVIETVTDGRGGRLFDLAASFRRVFKGRLARKTFRGRLGGPGHRATVEAAKADLEARRFKVKAEAGFTGRGGATKSRFADLIAYHHQTGAVEIVQVGDILKSTDLPIGREQKALMDILASGTHLTDILRKARIKDADITSVSVRFIEKLPNR